MRKKRSFQIALAGISAGFVILFVWLANFVGILSLTFYALSGCALMLPLSKKYYWSAGFAYVAASLLSILTVGNPFKVLPFIVFIGPYTIFMCVCVIKKIKPIIAIPIKVVFINGVLALFYFALSGLVIDFSNIEALANIHYAWLAVLLTLIMLVADILFGEVFKVIQKQMDRAIR